MTSEVRHTRLVSHLRKVESASIDELAELFGVSKMTIHRDLDRLEAQKIVRKSRGGATLLPSTVFEADYAYRSQLALSEKRLIARAVAGRIERGVAILIDDSSTAAQVIPFILEKRPLTIITNSLCVITDCSRVEGISVLDLGGSYDPVCNAFLGIVTEQAISRLRVDVALLSAGAIRGSYAYFHNPEVARFKLACLAAAERSLLMADHTKFGKSALHLFSHLNVFDEVISTDLLDSKIANELRNDNVKLELLPMTDAGNPTRFDDGEGTGEGTNVNRAT